MKLLALRLLYSALDYLSRRFFALAMRLTDAMLRTRYSIREEVVAGRIREAVSKHRMWN